MKYGELEVIDNMYRVKTSNKELIMSYIYQLPNWRDSVFTRHKKYILDLIKGKTYKDISENYGYSMEGIDNIFRKIQTCLIMELEELSKSVPVKKKVRVFTEKDNFLLDVFKLINLMDVNLDKVKNPIQLNLLKLIKETQDIEEIENKLSINSNSIYDVLFPENESSIFSQIK